MSKVMVVSFQSLTATSGAGMARLGYLLSKELHKRGLLDKFIVHSKGKYNTPFPCEPVSGLSRYYLLVLNKLNGIFNFKVHSFRFSQEKLFDWFCAKKINSSIDILFVTQPHMKRTLCKAKKLGIQTILLSGTPEDNYMYDLVSEENNKMGITEPDSYTYKKRNDYYNESVKYLDVVVGFFSTSHKTYEKSKAFTGRNVKLTGYLTPDFPAYDISNRKKTDGKFRVGYLAYTVVLKGLHYLLAGWDNLLKNYQIDDIELIIGGPIHPIVASYIEQNFGSVHKVTYVGQVSDVPNFMQSLDLLVVPSLIDGGPSTAIEAAHYGVPVLITDGAGAADLITTDKDGGYVIPIRNAKAIEEKIAWAYHNQEKNTEKGRNAKTNVENYSFEDYITTVGDFLAKELNER